MKLLPQSNGFYKVNMKEKKKPKDIFKTAISTILLFLLVGFIFQWSSNFIAKETLKERVDYVRVDDKRLDYLIEGDGSKYTIVFDGNIGSNMNQWDDIVEDLTSNYDDISTFVYNRRGYGFSDSGSRRTVKEQAEDLRILLRKSAAQAPYILVGEEYGSLVLTEFAKAYPDLVSGVVLINPIVEDEINLDNKFKSILFRSRVEKVGSYFGLTTLLDFLNLSIDTSEFESNLNEEDLEEFKAHRTKKSYTKAVNNELINIIKGNNTSQEEGIFKGKPYYLIAKSNQEVLKNLGDENLTTVYSVESDKSLLTYSQKDNIISAIRNVIKSANEIERVNK